MNQYLLFLFLPTVLCITAMVLVWLVARTVDWEEVAEFTDADVDKFLANNVELMDKIAELEKRDEHSRLLSSKPNTETRARESTPGDTGGVAIS